MNPELRQHRLKAFLETLPEQVQQVMLKDDFDVVILIHQIGTTYDLILDEVWWMYEIVRQVLACERKPEDFGVGLSEHLENYNRSKITDIAIDVNNIIFVKILPLLGMKALPVLSKPVPPPTPTPKPPQPLTGAVPPYVPPAPRSVFPSSVTTTAYKPPTTVPTPPRTVPINKFVPPAPSIQPTQQVPIPRPPSPPVATPISAPQINRPITSTVQTTKVPTFVTPMPIMPKPRPVTPPIPPNLPTQAVFSQTTPTPVRPSSVSDATGYTLHATRPLVEPSHDQMSANPTDSFLKMLAGKLSEKELQMRFDRLPQALKSALRNVDSARVVVDIGRKYALHIDKLGELGEETGLVILGITHPAQFIERLVRHLGTTEEKARQIGQEINTEVFLKIREALKQVGSSIPTSIPPTPKTSSAIPVPVPTKIVTTQKEELTPIKETTMTQNIKDLTINQETDQFPERDALLRDIENPAPSGFISTPISVPVQVPPQNIAKVLPTPEPEMAPVSPASIQAPIVTAQQTSPSPTPNIIDQKLSSRMSAPKSETRYTADPYRESLN